MEMSVASHFLLNKGEWECRSSLMSLLAPGAIFFAIVLVGCSDAVDDRTALEALYEATDGANWSNNANWLSEASLREWHGVITDRNGRVTGLSLSGNRLRGEIPAELGGLANLHGLSLSGNRLSGEIPAELGGLANLLELYLSGNQLSGGIPAELGSLANLQRLYLHENQLRGEIPAELGGSSKPA